jgi:hypothetical protein
MKTCYLALLIGLLFAGNCYSQTTTTTAPATTTVQTVVTTAAPVQSAPPTTTVPAGNIPRPSEPLNVPELDNYVTSCFGVYDQTNALQSQLNTIEQQVLVGKLSINDEDRIEAELNGFNTQLISSKTTALSLLASSSAINADVYQDLKNKPLKIPGALIRIKNATKALKVSLQNIHTMESVTMVNIDHKLNIPVKIDTTCNHVMAVPASTWKTSKTAIKITGVTLDTFNSLATGLAGISTVKSSEKSFSASGTSIIDVVHYGTTDDLLAAILAICNATVTSKNVTSSSKGKIDLAFTGQ